MNTKSFIKAFVFVVLTFLGIEISSLIIAKQPITTTWRKVNKNGLLANIENGKARHDFWGEKKYIILVNMVIGCQQKKRMKLFF